MIRVKGHNHSEKKIQHLPSLIDETVHFRCLCLHQHLLILPSFLMPHRSITCPMQNSVFFGVSCIAFYSPAGLLTYSPLLECNIHFHSPQKCTF